MKIETDLDGAVVSAIERHYMHANEKHPYFCDALFRENRKNVDGGPDRHLKLCRKNMRDRIRGGELDFLDVAECEVAELFVAWCNGNTTDAIEETYDVIAVLLRVIDVLQGRQALGRPKECEVAKC